MPKPSPQTRGADQQALPPLILREFGGINTQADRKSIGDNEFSWIENLMPIGYGNMPALPGVSNLLATIGATAYYTENANVGGTDYVYAFCTDGSAYQVNLSTFAVTNIAAAATFSTSGVSCTQWKNLGILIVDPAKGYYDWNITAGSTLTVIDATKVGIAIAVFAGRAWIAGTGSTARTITYTGTGGYNDFSAGGASGFFVMTDPTLHNNVTALVSANNFLYIFGDHSVDVLGDVRVSSGATLFTRTNLSASIGSSYPTSIIPYYRSVLFVNNIGIYSLYGSTPQKISDALDGIVRLIDFTKPITACQASIYNILCAAFCFTYKDPAGTRQLIAIFFNNKWFLASAGTIPKFIVGELVDLAEDVWACDGTNFYELFSSTTASVSTTLKTKLYDVGDPLLVKQLTKFGLGVQMASAPQSFTITVDSEYQSQTLTATGTNTLIWTNNAGMTIAWVNDLLNTITWLVAGYSFIATDADNYGRYLGATITSTDYGFTYNLLAMKQFPGPEWGDEPL